MSSSTPGTVRLDVEGRGTTITLAGRLDERTLLGGVAAKVTTNEVAIDLSGVSFINSLGLREWVKLLRELKAKQLHVVLRRCSEAMVAQMNMIDDAATGVSIESMELPYVCEKCGFEGPALVEVREHQALLRKMEVPSLPCPECKEPMTFAEVAEQYLYFFTKTR
jgi:anti-anti-sigma regulatory factor